MKIRGKKKKFIACIIAAFIIWLFWGYVEVGVLTWKYGDIFEKEYRQSYYFMYSNLGKARVFRYKDEKARVSSDSKFVEEFMEDERENVAVVCYSTEIVAIFEYDGTEWVFDNFGVLQSPTTSTATWPFYLW